MPGVRSGGKPARGAAFVRSASLAAHMSRSGPVCLLAALLAAGLAGCLPGPALLADVPDAPAFRPETFFAGRTTGDVHLTIRTRAPQRLRVESVGVAQADGTFRLDQAITYPDGHVDRRTWTMRRLGDGRYASTLTPDARGEVRVEAAGRALRIRYRMGRVTTMDQTLALREGGQTADNVATVRMLGVPVARLTETITRG